MTDFETLNIRHDPAARRFVADIGGHEAVLDYRILEDKTLDYRRTFVPPASRGRGIASGLAKHALEYARENGFRVVPSCAFVERYMDAHPEYEPLRATRGV